MGQVQQIIGYVIIAAGIIFMLFGLIGIFRYKNFYPRVLLASKVDTVGAFTLLIGVGVQRGLSFFTGRLFLLLLIILILNPLVAHILVRSAYLSGHKTE